MTRIKATTFKTRDEFFAALNELANIQTELRRLSAKRDARIQAIQEEYAPATEQLGEQIKALVALCEKYATAHRDALLPGKAKSAETELATYGFRLGQPTLVLMSRKWSWETVVEACKATFPGRFVRTKESVDKDSLKAELNDADLARIGCRIQQDDTFFIEPKVDGGEQIKKEVA